MAAPRSASTGGSSSPPPSPFPREESCRQFTKPTVSASTTLLASNLSRTKADPQILPNKPGAGDNSAECLVCFVSGLINWKPSFSPLPRAQLIRNVCQRSFAYETFVKISLLPWPEPSPHIDLIRSCFFFLFPSLPISCAKTPSIPPAPKSFPSLKKVNAIFVIPCSLTPPPLGSAKRQDLNKGGFRKRLGDIKEDEKKLSSVLKLLQIASAFVCARGHALGKGNKRVRGGKLVQSSVRRFPNPVAGFFHLSDQGSYGSPRLWP